MISDHQPKRKLKQNRLPLWDWIRLAKPYRIYTGMDEAECIEALCKIAKRRRTRSLYQFEVSVETLKGFKITESYSSKGGYKKRTLIDGVLQIEPNMGVVQISGCVYYGGILLETLLNGLLFLSGILLLFIAPEILCGWLFVLIGGTSLFPGYYQKSKSRRRMLQEIRTELKTIEGRNLRRQG